DLLAAGELHRRAPLARRDRGRALLGDDVGLLLAVDADLRLRVGVDGDLAARRADGRLIVARGNFDRADLHLHEIALLAGGRIELRVDLEQRAGPDRVERAVGEDQLRRRPVAGLHPVAVVERRARLGRLPVAG